MRARDAEEALGALKGALARAAPESFMLWLHRWVVVVVVVVVVMVVLMMIVMVVVIG